ncbi:hypothetical protein B9Z19DRAFT_1087221 [Tuber borchii]|uniref:Uncharacterized protein n=1 Tax=Tuber borchii TaxID=42251 RepID=A0A2T6ZN81_TUBBO|nr:hypothetical protein B9Z19DRAFT_1087221 [Tuber borchii]
MSNTIFKAIINAHETPHCDLLVFENVDPEDFARTMKHLQPHRTANRAYPVRIHWFSSERRLKVVMPSMIHGGAGSWLIQTINRARGRGLMSGAWEHTIMTAIAPEYKNFIGKYAGSMKEADFTIIPRIGPGRKQLAAFPSVVMESGRYESSAQLQADARLWQEGSAGAVRVVLQVKYYEPDHHNNVALDLFISRTAPGGGPASQEHYHIIPAPPQPHYPSISLDEFYAGHCPPTMNPKTQITLDLEMLHDLVKVCSKKHGAPPP